MTQSTHQDLEVFYDAACPLCRREIDLVRRLDRDGRIAFTDIADEDFVPPAPLGRAQLAARIHARLPDGTILEGVEVFRRMYAAVGLAPFVAVTRLQPISWALDRGYDWFARNRLRITGRCTDDTCEA